MRPLADRVAGIDDALLAAAAAAPTTLDDTALGVARVCAAVFVRRHGDLLDFLADGGQPVLAVADGLVPWWPEHAELDSGWVRHGAELLPVADAVLAEVVDGELDPTAVHDAVSDTAALLRAHRPPGDSFTRDVAVELLEALVVASLQRGC
jgi:hypothetical protein